ncbi:MAG: SgcJ/EcaC family oxidoreductase [Gemmatimonadota bacterium]
MSDAQEAVRTGNQDLCDALARGDAKGMAALYTPEGRLLPPGSDIVSGRDAIGTFWQGAMDMGIAGATLETVTLEEMNGIVTEIGRFVLTAADGSQIDHGKYLVVWKHHGGRWRLHWDIWNSSVPPAGG